jgi:hypothetical protein
VEQPWQKTYDPVAVKVIVGDVGGDVSPHNRAGVSSLACIKRQCFDLVSIRSKPVSYPLHELIKSVVCSDFPAGDS